MGENSKGARFDCMREDVNDLGGVSDALDWAEYRIGVCRTLVGAAFQALDTAGRDVEDVAACSNLMQAVDDVLVTVAQQIGHIQEGVGAMPDIGSDGEGGAADFDLGSD